MRDPFTFDRLDRSVRDRAVFILNFHKDWLHVFVEAIKETNSGHAMFLSRIEHSMGSQWNNDYHSLWSDDLDYLPAVKEFYEMAGFEVGLHSSGDHPDLETRFAVVGTRRAINAVKHLLTRYQRN